MEEEGGRKDEEGRACKSIFREEDLPDGRRSGGEMEEEEKREGGRIEEGLIK